MKTLNLQSGIGKIGEDICVKYLINDGFMLISRNYLEKTGEIDIIARKANLLHFIEVKSVSCENLNEIDLLLFKPEDNVHTKKLQRLYKTIELYKLRNKVSNDQKWQIDIASVYVDESSKKAKVKIMWNVIE